MINRLNREIKELSKKKAFLWGMIITALLVSQPYRLAFNGSNSVPQTVFIIDTSAKKFQKGDYVLFLNPTKGFWDENLSLNKPFVKKIVGAQGDAIQRNSNTLVINERTLNKNPDTSLYLTSERIVPVNHYFMAGDNDNSYDSRYYGSIPFHFIFAKAYPLF